MLEKVIVDNLDILDHKLKNKFDYLKSEVFESNKGNLCFSLKILINPHIGYICLIFTLKENLFLNGELFLSEEMSPLLDSFDEKLEEVEYP